MATRSVPNLTNEAALVASQAAQEKAKSMGIDFNIALVDASLYLLHFTRMPNAKLTSIDIAINKAFTAAGHHVPTSTYTASQAAKNFIPGGPGYSIHNSNGGKFTLIGGGLPIELDGRVVGAIGVSTGTPAQDTEVAQAGVDALNAWVKRKSGSRL
ncbi:hypothetical protein CLAFUW4_11470 [Fulvia fulva]|uniref:DUF336-domain-containing protein n=1 Tax=Passalora fulva TaxID=5499 RepID=A0A9Q8PCZ0_PASFU|nr:uncharacterized protein CLAFUR5_10513 [Fulvia fulva]KAK4619986.1 hypothetical protein CLAFUR4_11476 [Fulvia fulva]KAK4620684.1 hypothetical protein CLAFUR0_11484 [Fulvia fulva]UJO20150.1 hypothetical protein CLAFUR5_10513 [Fulvia fulva]WPV17715.1 hypothetical protein CLAFUW4_11470 [Fulvia fulva]WPV31978.1 hypothetical protein CLAFUW7_11475 [Fulvia fulva]